ncbi:hypothetical protein [Agrococcus versicolor]|uniref:hypothetical protein n=1 Tax=Agrococcus versicolor TaxID=501482 RepID=UPI0031DF8985
MRRLLGSIGAFLASISALPFSHPEVSRRLEEADDERHETRDDQGDRPSTTR